MGWFPPTPFFVPEIRNCEFIGPFLIKTFFLERRQKDNLNQSGVDAIKHFHLNSNKLECLLILSSILDSLQIQKPI